MRYTLKFIDAIKELSKIDKIFNKYVRCDHIYNSIESIVDPVLKYNDRLERIVYICAMFKASLISQFTKECHPLFQEHLKDIGFLFKHNIKGVRSEVGAFMVNTNDPKLRTRINNMVDDLLGVFEAYEDEARCVKFIGATSKLSDENFIRLLSINADGINVFSCLRIRIKNEHSNNGRILTYIQNIPDIEKLYQNGKLMLTNEAMDVFNDELLSKIINAICAEKSLG